MYLWLEDKDKDCKLVLVDKDKDCKLVLVDKDFPGGQHWVTVKMAY